MWIQELKGGFIFLSGLGEIGYKSPLTRQIYKSLNCREAGRWLGEFFCQVEVDSVLAGLACRLIPLEDVWALFSTVNTQGLIYQRYVRQKAVCTAILTQVWYLSIWTWTYSLPKVHVRCRTPHLSEVRTVENCVHGYFHARLGIDQSGVTVWFCQISHHVWHQVSAATQQDL